jgi:hypothetical protein
VGKYNEEEAPLQLPSRIAYITGTPAIILLQIRNGYGSIKNIEKRLEYSYEAAEKKLLQQTTT